MKMSRFEKVFVNGAGHSRQVARNAERLLAFAVPSPGQRYLDVGCGNGAAPLHLARSHGLEVVGVDVDPQQIETARRLGAGLARATFLTLDGSRLPFDDGEFDTVATHKVTHHVASWRSLLVEMARVLKPGGHFIYADLVYPPWLAAVGEKMSRSYGFPTVEAVESLLPRLGLHPLHSARSAMAYEAVCRLAG